MQKEPLAPGTIVFGKYKIIRPLGTGATSAVYACKRSGHPSNVLALKILNVDLASEDLIRRFRHEIHASYRISHPNVVRGFESFRVDGLEAYTMECVEGGNLEDVLQDVEEKLSIQEILRILIQTCQGLTAIHAAGYVHRDLKPGNIFMTNDGSPKIGDFNTVLCPSIRSRRFDFGTIGTLEYMSPEVLATGVADTRSDIYAIGAIAYEMVTGELPFEADCRKKMLRLKKRRRPKSPHRLRSDCPRELSTLIMKALRSKPRARYQSAEELLAQLCRITPRNGIGSCR